MTTKARMNRMSRTIAGGRRGSLLLRKFRLCPVDLLLVLVELVLLMLGFLGNRNRSLVRDSVDDAERERRPSQNL